jgi:hypothetical protein
MLMFELNEQISNHSSGVCAGILYSSYSGPFFDHNSQYRAPRFVGLREKSLGLKGLLCIILSIVMS